MRVCIRWTTDDPQARERIRQRFRIPRYTTLNDLSPADVPEEDTGVFRETVRRGFFSIINVPWEDNGGTFVLKTR